MTNLLTIKNLQKNYITVKEEIKAIDTINLDIYKDERDKYMMIKEIEKLKIDKSNNN